MAVADTGYGIPASEQTLVFNRLFRASNIETREIEGTGFGLYMIKSLVDHLNGNIWFTSAEGVGTTFFVSIPVAKI